MAGRPEILFPLFADLTKLPGIGPKTVGNYERMGVTRPRDLLFTLPQSGIDRRLRPSIAGQPPGVVTVEVEVLNHQPPRQPGRPHRVWVSDGEAEFALIFFHARTDWLNRHLPVGARRVVSGKHEHFDGGAQIAHPDHILALDNLADLPEFEPVYPLSQGITQKGITKATRAALDRTPELPEWIDPRVLKDRGWPHWREAMVRAHAPERIEDVAATHPARERLAYDELLSHQLTLGLARARVRRAPGVETRGDGRLRAAALKALPYAPTAAQTRAVGEIVADLGEPRRMNRLLQGDVGSGKTLVALLSMLAVVEAGGQAALMAPTEILARQHMEGLGPLAADLGIRMEILTGRDKGGERAERLAALAAGKIDI
ncbi:MAG: DEAD/DEAH box helicase, partial [Pseudomonadota bacterium]